MVERVAVWTWAAMLGLNESCQEGAVVETGCKGRACEVSEQG